MERTGSVWETGASCFLTQNLIQSSLEKIGPRGMEILSDLLIVPPGVLHQTNTSHSNSFGSDAEKTRLAAVPLTVNIL